MRVQNYGAQMKEGAPIRYIGAPNEISLVTHSSFFHVQVLKVHLADQRGAARTTAGCAQRISVASLDGMQVAALSTSTIVSCTLRIIKAGIADTRSAPRCRSSGRKLPTYKYQPLDSRAGYRRRARCTPLTHEADTRDGK